MSSKDEGELRRILTEDPGNERFVELARLLREAGRKLEAVEVCFAGLSASPQCHDGRLELARAFYELGYIPFAAREVSELRSIYPASSDLQKLAELLGAVETVESQAPQPAGSPDTVAEAEFDADEIELIDSNEDKPT